MAIDTSRPPIVTLCGSTRFKDAFVSAQFTEALNGRIVLTIACDLRSDTDLFGHLSEQKWRSVKDQLDILHLHKIRLSDEILVLNVGGYVGESTRREIAYARFLGKRVRWLERNTADEILPYDAMRVFKEVTTR